MITVKMDRKTRKVLFENEGQRFIENGIRQALYEMGKLLEKEVTQGIKNPPKTGRFYGKHQASKGGVPPQEYPANKTGGLKRSINFKVKNNKQMVFGATAEYAVYLEDGTTKMDPRRLLGYTIEKNTNKLRDILRKNINGEIK